MTFDDYGNRIYRLLCKSQILLKLLQGDLEAYMYSRTNWHGPFHIDKSISPWNLFVAPVKYCGNTYSIVLKKFGRSSNIPTTE